MEIRYDEASGAPSGRVRTWVPECPHCRKSLLSPDEPPAGAPALRVAPDGTLPCHTCGKRVRLALDNISWIRVRPLGGNEP